MTDIENPDSTAIDCDLIGRRTWPACRLVVALALGALGAGCDDDGKKAAESESARVVEGEKPAESDTGKAPCTNSEEPVKFACSDADGPEDYREHQLWMARVVGDVFSELNQKQEAP